MLDVFIFTVIEMSFTGRKKVFRVLEYARSQSNKHAFVREFSRQSPAAMQIYTWKKNTERKVIHV